MTGGILAVLCAVLASCVVRGAGQAFHGFNWDFNFGAGVPYPHSFQECQDVPIKLLPLNNGSLFGVPPYYMFAFESSGIPTATAIGNDGSNLSWKANHKEGSVLMLTMVDSKNQTGGIPNVQYTMEAPISGSSSCLPTPSQDIAFITPNITDSLSTCQPWGLKITGGKKPYSIVFTAFNSTTMTNVTMRPTDDVYVYINRADPGAQLMASVVDADGSWGNSTPFVNTTGSTDVTCPGLASSSFDSSSTSFQDAPRATKHAKPKNAPLIAGVVVGLLLVAAIGVLAWLWLRRLRNRNQTYDSDGIFAGPWEGHGTGVAEWSPDSLIPSSVPRHSTSESVRIFQHHDADIVQELPPPYAEGAERVPPPLEKTVGITLRPGIGGWEGAHTGAVSVMAGPSQGYLGH